MLQFSKLPRSSNLFAFSQPRIITTTMSPGTNRRWEARGNYFNRFSHFRRRLGRSSHPARTLRRADNIIAALERGIAVLNADFRILWANTPFRKWCPDDPIGQTFPSAIGPFTLLWPDTFPSALALSGQTVSVHLLHSNSRHLDLNITPIRDNDAIHELVVVCTDITASVIRQQKLDALHRAGQELAALDTELLSEMSVCNRAELLKLNLQRHIHDLLQYNVIEIRLLNPRNRKLEPLLEEGMTPDAAGAISTPSRRATA